MLTRTTRIAIAIAALVMSAAYGLPLWRIALVAPQYPEGLGMLIRINGIDGFKDGDLQSINGLNHYIGMKAIVPESIPELKYMPLILAALIVGGLAVAWIGRRLPFAAWAVGMGAVFAAGLVDYWKWGYDYGHDLNPNAIIRVPGMTYQPPLIGSKQLLNFQATSWPGAGGWILIAVAIVVGVLVVRAYRSHGGGAAIAGAALALGAACAAPGPRALVLQQDACAQCRMVIADARYGGEAITSTGRVLTFDAIECLAAYARTAPPGTVRAMYVIDVQHPGTFVRADSAAFLRGALIGSPMGRGIVGLASPAAAESQRAMLGGTVATWAEVLADTAHAEGKGA